jgi:hypothetical protein
MSRAASSTLRTRDSGYQGFANQRHNPAAVVTESHLLPFIIIDFIVIVITIQ